MKIRYLLLLFAAVISLTLGARSQSVHAAPPEPAGLRNVTLWVNPEYDDPRLLVMLEGKIAGANPPAQIRFLVPSSAVMFSAGSKDAQGKYTGGPPARTPSSIPGWDEISYTVTTDTFRVEYYDASAIVGQPDKKISYDFRWLYPIADLYVVIQQPRTAANFDVAPKGLAGTDGDGLAIQSYRYQNLGINDPPLHYDILYTKADSDVSINDPQLNSSGSTGSTEIKTILLVMLASVIVLGGAFWILKSMKSSKRPVRNAADKRTVTASGGKRRSGGRFCPKCGRPIQGTDKFCPGCGNRVS
ncbi:MAG: hypothetical protein HW402_643 [Dehalococcoidales bacterium]|nr:hypothetical protein [Dehalococcoidales bacterium]